MRGEDIFNQCFSNPKLHPTTAESLLHDLFYLSPAIKTSNFHVYNVSLATTKIAYKGKKHHILGRVWGDILSSWYTRKISINAKALKILKKPETQKTNLQTNTKPPQQNPEKKEEANGRMFKAPAWPRAAGMHLQFCGTSGWGRRRQWGLSGTHSSDSLTGTCSFSCFSTVISETQLWSWVCIN